jgi:hypothetical protein
MKNIRTHTKTLKFTKTFSSETGEVLFTGYNKRKAIGVKCTCELLGVDNKKYFEAIKRENESEINTYRVSTPKKETESSSKSSNSDDKSKREKYEITGEEVTLKNVKALQSIYDANLNPSNEFRFITTLFSKNDYNYKLDIWIRKTLYDNQKEYIARIINSIDFIETDKEKKEDSSEK